MGIRRWHYERKNREGRISHHYWEITELLKKFNFNDEELKDYIKSVKKELNESYSYSELGNERNRLEMRLLDCEKNLIKREQRKELDYIEARKRQVEKEIEELERQKREKFYQEEERKEMILFQLKVEDNLVFKRERLNKKEVSVLLENGYSQVNEFCVYEKKRISVLVKPELRHTANHTFLIWSAKRLLKKTKGVSKIRETLTRDADIIFEFNGKNYALEIETGNLLRKHEQLKEKIAYMNKKYPSRWMFIVSNRDFLTKFRKFGHTTERKGVWENLAKMLQI